MSTLSTKKGKRILNGISIRKPKLENKKKKDVGLLWLLMMMSLMSSLKVQFRQYWLSFINYIFTFDRSLSRFENPLLGALEERKKRHARKYFHRAINWKNVFPKFKPLWVCRRCFQQSQLLDQHETRMRSEGSELWRDGLFFELGICHARYTCFRKKYA